MNPLKENPTSIQTQPVPGGLPPSLKLPLLAGALLLGGLWAASAANVTLRTSDAANTTSFTGSTNWNPTGVPAPGNAYFTGAFTIRTTNATTSGANVVFQGDSLSIDAGGRMIGKIGNNASGNTASNAITVNLILNGGYLDQAGANSDHAVLTVAGNITVAAASGLGALGATGNGSANFETLNLTATIGGSGALVVSGSTINGGGDTGPVILGAANPYSGTLTVTNGYSGSTAVIASTVNRLVQLNNVDALSNATLNLVSTVANPVSFVAGVNTAPFNVGALTGKASQTLLDTTGVAVTLSVGANNASTTFAGTLTDGGNLVKVGSGTLTFTGTNTYYGATTISGGSLQLGNGGAGGALYVGNTLTLNGNLTINRNNTAAQGVDFSSYPISGSGSFTQVGTGTTILNMANSYSGPTTVSAGKLVISTAQTGTGAITVANGARLGITVSGTSQLSPSTLALGTSAATTLEFDGLNSTTLAPVNVGTLALGGPVTVNINSGTFAAGNSYPLVHWNASGPANASGFALGVSPGLTATFSLTGSTLYLNVSAVSDIWTGALSGNWDTATANWTGNATVFANGQSVLFDDTAVGTTIITVSAPVQPGSIVFNNANLVYNLASSGANAIGGSSGLTLLNSGSLTLSGGANTFTGPTTINHGFLSVGTLANGGQPSDLGAASAASANLVLNGGTLQYTGEAAATDRGATLGASGGTLEVSSPTAVLTSSGVIAGSGPLTKTGVGTLTLLGPSTFSGGLSVGAGQVNINNGGSTSASSAIGVGPLTLGDGTTLDNTSGANLTLLPNNAQVWNGSFIYAGTANSLNLGTGPVSLPATVTVTVNANTLTVGGAISGPGGLTKAGPGTLLLSGVSSFTGTMDLQGGTLAVGNDLALGAGQLNFADGTTIQSADGAAHTITNRLNFGSGAGGNNIFAGTGNLKFTGSAANGTAKIMTVNNPQTEFSGVLSGAMARTVAGTGVLVYSGANTYTLGTTINLGATLQLGNGDTNGSLSTSGVIDVEGTLVFNRSDALLQGTHFSSAPIIGAGGLVQAGAGVTTLNAANTYTGPTMVNNGELFITPAAQGGGNVVVANGAKFGVLASAVTNSATIGNLTLGSGGATTLDFSYGLPGNPTNAALSAAAVTISGTSTIRIGGTFAVGTFPVLKYGTLSGAFSGTVVGPRGVTATLSNDTINHVINVTVSSVGSGIVWTGTSSISPNLWDLNTSTNWLIGGQPTIYLENVPPGDAVAFNDQGSGLVLLSNTVSPASVTLNNASTAYTFQGSGQITSPGALTKVGAATVTLNVPASFGGNTVLSNGTVSIGANQSFANLSGNSAVTVSAGAPTLTVNNSQNTTFAGSVGGALTLTKTGTGVLTLPGSNSFTGNLFVKAGAMTLDSGFMNVNNFCSIGQNDSDNGTLTLKGTATFNTANDFNVGDVGSSVGILNIQDSASLTVNSFFIGSANGAGSTASGTVNQTGGTVTELNTGTGTFCIGGRVDSTSISAVGVYNLSGGTLLAGAGIRVGSAGTGTLNQSGGTIIATNGINIARVAGSVGTYNFDGGTLKTTSVGSSTAVNATFNCNGGVLMPLGDSTGFVTNITQVNVRNGGLVVDTAGFSVTIGQALAHSTLPGDNAVDGGLTKRGNGTLTLGELGSTYTGPTLVLGGGLNLFPNSFATPTSLTVSNAALGLYLNGGAASYSPTALTLMGNSALNLNYDLVSGIPAAALNLSGGFSVSGVTVINLTGYGFPVGQFPLVHYSGAPLANLNNFALGALPYGVTASLVNNQANTSIDLVVSSVSVTTWIPLLGTDPAGTSGFATAGTWQDGNPPTPGNGYFTRGFSLRSPADASAYTFAGSALSVDTGGRFIMKGTNGQALTVNNLIINGGLVDYANGGDNFTETLGGHITLQGGLTSYIGALGSAGASETLFVTASIGGTGNLQLAGGSVNSGGDNGVVVLAGTNTYTGTTTVAGGTLLVNGANGNSAVTVIANGTLGGAGVVAGPVTVQAGATLAPGTPTRGALTAALGTLTLNGGATLAGAVSMKMDRAATPASDRVIAPSVVINPGASLVVNNLGSTNLVAGDTFALFSSPVSGAFTAVTLPPLPSPSLYWTNRLAVNGTIAVASTATVNPNPAPIGLSVSGSTLTLSWPADHLGWHLQVQTNAAGAGLGTNWVTIPGSDAVTSTNLTITPAAGSVFYRMVYP